MTKKQLIILIVLYSVLAIIVYFGFLDEYLDYLEVKKNKTPESFQEFYKSHPSGFYIDDVKFIEIQHIKDYALVKNFFS